MTCLNWFMSLIRQGRYIQDGPGQMCETWASGHVGIWVRGHLDTWASGHVGIWAGKNIYERTSIQNRNFLKKSKIFGKIENF